MVIVLILCIIANCVCCFFAAKIGEGETDLKKRKDRSNLFFVASIILSIVASIILVNIIDSNSKGAGVAKYNYYVNGKKVSSATYGATQNFFIGFMFFVVLFGTGMGISANVVKRKNKVKTDNKNKKPNVVALIFSILSSVFGSMLVIAGISAMANLLQKNSEVAPVISMILGIALFALGIWGILVFVKRKNLEKTSQSN